MCSNLKRRYRRYCWVFVGADFHSEGGAWRSVHALYNHLDQSGKYSLLIDLRRRDGWRQWVCALLFSPRILVNGMAAVERWRVLIGLCLRSDVAIFLHDTAYMLDVMLRAKPLRYRLLSHLLKTRTVLCVSKQMAALYRERFGALKTEVVYEVTELKPDPDFESCRIHVVMVGSLNRRKGYHLFVEVAELAAKRGLPWQFHWVGGLGEADLAPVSRSITWWGWRESAAPIVRQADVFFLSSLDDPQPLAVLEALAMGKRVVVYSGTGSAEVVGGLPGCRVFTRHQASEALDALGSAIGEVPDENQYRDRLRLYADVASFRKRLEACWSAIKENRRNS